MKNTNKNSNVNVGSSSPEKKEHPTEIFEYIRRKRHGKVLKVGVIVGRSTFGTVKIGWSKCNFKLGDKFDVTEGLKIAKTRATDTGIAQAIPPTPLCIRRQVRQFGARCVRYFKDANRVEFV